MTAAAAALKRMCSAMGPAWVTASAEITTEPVAARLVSAIETPALTVRSWACSARTLASAAAGLQRSVDTVEPSAYLMVLTAQTVQLDSEPALEPAVVAAY